MVLAEAGDAIRVGSAGVRGADGVVQRALPLRSPHHAVDLVGFAEVGGQPGEEIFVIGMQRAERACRAALEVDLPERLDAGNVDAKTSSYQQ